jgi:N-acetylglucosaminyldiphosphoundecaprenol N-acetyl-beta-D-mannosaminyltransferase
MRLLVIGINGPETERIHQTVAAHKLEGRTSFVSGLSDAELHWCYANCSVLVAPSSTEGFGLPVAEGLLAGCRIVCSEIGAHREIGAERCRFVNLREDAEHALAEAIAGALDEIPSQPRPKRVSLPQLSAEAVGEQYIRLYHRLLEARAVGNRHSSTIATRSADREQTLKADFAHPHADVLKVQVSAVNLEQATELACRWIDRGGSGYACMTGVHGVMEAQRDEPLRGILNGAVLNAPDGTPLTWVGRLQGFREMNYVTGPQFMERMCEIAAERGYRIFLYGGNPGVAELLSDRLQARFPGLRVAGTWTPPFRPLNAKEEEEMLTAVRRARPHLMWVGLSTPRQERFMAQYVERLEVPLLVGVGAAFDYHTGRLRDCPRWVKRAGLQWLHRLVQEPRRLAPRYLRNNPAFLWRVLLQLAGMRDGAANLQRAADDAQGKYEAGT